ncbi:MAG: type VI secretion system baseplate subunit TssK [Isosphaeraceae bacterium]
MAKQPVHWSEGMFLKPHHFQAADRYARERLRESEEWFHPHGWGVRSFRIDPDALKNSQARVLECQARFRDGTTVTLPEEGSLDPLDIRPALEGRGETTLMLALPTWKEDRANIEAGGNRAEWARFGVQTIDKPDENTGGDEEPVDFRWPRVRLLSSHIDTTGFELLPLARIRRGSGEGATPEVDRSYIPPILQVDGWTPLREDADRFFQQLQSVVRQESEYLVGRKLSFDSQVLGEAERILKLAQCNAAYSLLQGILPTRGLHPFGLYAELCRLIGQLSLFDETRRPIDLPAYDHDDLGPRFAKLFDELRRLLGLLGRTPAIKRYFEFQQSDGKFKVALDPDWFEEATRLYLGIETVDLNDAECDALIRGKEWKMGAEDKIDEIFRERQPGLVTRPLERIPPSLPRNVVYYEIERRPEYWRDVLRTRTLALRFRLQGGGFKTSRIVRLVSDQTMRDVDLMFAIYVIKPTT